MEEELEKRGEVTEKKLERKDGNGGVIWRELTLSLCNKILSIKPITVKPILCQTHRYSCNLDDKIKYLLFSRFSPLCQ